MSTSGREHARRRRGASHDSYPNEMIDLSILTVEQVAELVHLSPRPSCGQSIRADDLEASQRTQGRGGGSAQPLIPRPDDERWREHDYRNWRRRVVKPAIKAAALPITRPYDSRHACACLMIHAGNPLDRNRRTHGPLRRGPRARLRATDRRHGRGQPANVRHRRHHVRTNRSRPHGALTSEQP